MKVVQVSRVFRGQVCMLEVNIESDRGLFDEESPLRGLEPGKTRVLEAGKVSQILWRRFGLRSGLDNKLFAFT